MDNPTKKVAVIGSGIAGCATAHMLAQRGLNVTVFEREKTVSPAASGNPIAMLYPRLSGDNVQSHYALAAYQHSLAFYQSLALNDDHFQQCGMLQLGFNQREQQRIEKVAATLPSNIAHLVTAEEATQIANVECKQPALYFSQAAWLIPSAVCQRLLNHKNISLQRLIDIQSISSTNGTHQVAVAGHIGTFPHTFDSVVICNANDAKQFPKAQHANHQAVRGQLTQLSSTPLSEQLNSILCADGYLSPAIDEHHLCGATFMPDASHTTVTEADHQENLAKISRISKQVHHELSNNVTGGRTAFRCVSQDRLPIVGQLLDIAALKAAPPRPSANPDTLPWVSGLYLNIAHGSHGFTSAPFAADLLAHLISGQPLNSAHHLFSYLNPNRFLLKTMGLKKLARCLATDKVF